MNQLATIQTPNVQIFGTSDHPCFIAGDLVTALGLTDVRRALASLPDDEKGTVNIRTLSPDIRGQRRGKPNVRFVTEAGFWRLCFKSRKPQAKMIQDHVYNVLLPNWRRGHSQGKGIPPRVPPQLTAWRNARLQFRLRLCEELLQHCKWGEFVKASDQIARREGISGGSLRRWFYRWKKSGFDNLSLIFPSLIYGWDHPADLPAAPAPIQIEDEIGGS